jgi:peptide/nickel transport system permease protein
MKALGFVFRKFLRVMSLMFAASLFSFILVKSSPLDPIIAYVGGDHMASLTQEVRANLEQKWGLDKPVHVQYIYWFSNILRGDWGRSSIYNRSVLGVISQKAMASLALMGLAWVISGVLGFLLGIIGGMNREKWVDRLIRWYCITLASSPAFWIGLLLLMVFGVWLGWFPIGLGAPMGRMSGDVSVWEKIYHLVLPALTLSVAGVANIALHTREKLVEVLQSEYILYAKARGESSWTALRRHGLRNIALPAITLQFASLNELFGGSVLAETVFSYPGLGSAVSQAGLHGDVPLLLGIVLFSVVIIYAGNFIANVLYGVLDPRIREGVRHV